MEIEKNILEGKTIYLKSRNPDYMSGKQSSLQKTDLIISNDKEATLGARAGAFFKKKETQKTYYVVDHPETEYFASEILTLNGVKTPKIRFAEVNPFDPPWNHSSVTTNGSRTKVASKKVEELIPIYLLTGPKMSMQVMPDYSMYEKFLLEMHHQYQLDFQAQKIVDLKTGVDYKISGFFGTHIAYALIQDSDVIRNMNFKKIGNRFYLIKIDNERVSLSDDEEKQWPQLEEILKKQEEEIKIHCFGNSTPEQNLYQAYQIHRMTHQQDGTSPLEKVFSSPRIEKTKALSFLKDKMSGIQTTVVKRSNTIFNFYFPTNNSFIEFKEREAIRNKIAKKVILKVKGELCLSEDQIKDIIILIMEDLRAPYYHTYFKDQNGLITEEDETNEELLNEIHGSVVREITLQSQVVPMSRPGL